MDFSYLISGEHVAEPEPRYPHLRRRDHHQMSVLTIAIAASFALAAAMVVSAVAFSFAALDATSELGRLYGEPKCPHGKSYYAAPVNNYAPCCSHYAQTCCDLHGGACSFGYNFSEALATDATAATAWAHHIRNPRCSTLLSLLSCARCSPFAGHYMGHSTYLHHRPNLTVCDGFCKELWEACTGGFAHSSVRGADHSVPHLAFCTQQLGLQVGGQLLPHRRRALAIGAERSAPGIGALHGRGGSPAAPPAAVDDGNADDDGYAYDDGDDEADAYKYDAFDPAGATCFNAAKLASRPWRWLSLGLPLLLAATMMQLSHAAGSRSS